MGEVASILCWILATEGNITPGSARVLPRGRASMVECRLTFNVGKRMEANGRTLRTATKKATPGRAQSRHRRNPVLTRRSAVDSRVARESLP